MAIRLRSVAGHLVALCAARSQRAPGDVYLDDAMHEALAHKFGGDWKKTGHDTPYEYDQRATAAEEVKEMRS